MSLPEIHIFDAGTWYDNEGRKHVITSEQLQTIAENFNASNAEAPLTPDHPRNKAIDFSTLPSYAWFNKLRVDGGKMFAQVSRASDALVQCVKDGIVKGLSAGFSDNFTKFTHVAALPSHIDPALPHLEPLGSYFSKQSPITEYHFAMADNPTPDAGTSSEPTMQDILKEIKDGFKSVIDAVNGDKKTVDAPKEITDPAPAGFSAASPEFVALQKANSELSAKVKRNEIAEMLRGEEFAGKITPAEFSHKVDLLEILSSGANFSASVDNTPYANEVKLLKARTPFNMEEQATHFSAPTDSATSHKSLVDMIVANNK